MAFRNPEQAYFEGRTRHEEPLSHQEEALVTEFSRRRRTEGNLKKTPLRDIIAGASPHSDTYTRSEIEHDERLAAEHRLRWGSGEQTERAQLVEDLMSDSSQFGWFGNPESVKLLGTTDYDDRVNFVDAVAAFRRKDGSSGYLAIDFIAARSDAPSLIKKRRGIERKIISGEQHSVKYLPERSHENKPVIKHIDGMAQVVIGLDPSTLTELSTHLYGYHCPEAALKEYRAKHGLKAYNKENPQTPQAMKEKARQDLAKHPIAYEIAQEAFAQLESQALLALNVFLDRSADVLKADRTLYNHLDQLRAFERGIEEYRATMFVDHSQVPREETVAALERVIVLLTDLAPLETKTGYPVRSIVKKLLPYVKYFGTLATKRQTLYNPEKEDPTVKRLAQPWECDQRTRRELLAAA